MAQVMMVRRRVRNFHHPWWRKALAALLALVAAWVQGYGEYLIASGHAGGSGYYSGWID